MIENRISQYGQNVSVMQAPVWEYGITSYVIQDKDGKYCGTLTLNGNGRVALTSSREHVGLTVTEAEDLVTEK